MRQLNEKERTSNGDNSSEFADRFRIYDDQLSKFEQLREELKQKDKLISDLQTVVNSGGIGSHHSKSKNMNSSPITPVGKFVIIFRHNLFSIINVTDYLCH